MGISTRKISHVLLADDDEDDRTLFTEAVHNVAAHIKVTLVENEPNLLIFLSNEIVPEVIFLDVNMPDKNGYDCVIEMKQYTRLSKIPIVSILIKNGRCCKAFLNPACFL